MTFQNGCTILASGGKKNEIFFKYKPFKKIKKSLNLKIKKDNPFEALKQLDLK